MKEKFEFNNRQRLDNKVRRIILPPDKTLIRFGLKNGGIIADIGAGIGYFSVPASKIVGPEGFVYALDISREMLNEIDKIIKKNSISNIKTIKVEDSKLLIEDNAANFAFACNVLHEVDDLDRIINEIKRILMPGGKVAIIEWKKIIGSFGPPISERLDPEILISKLKVAGFSDLKKFDINKDLFAIEGNKLINKAVAN
jgi:ubiquinone/menaquinone biosynthesis C-methylase UbiE